MLFIIILIGVLFVVLGTAKLKLHPFLALLISAFFVGIASGMPLLTVVESINTGFGGLMTSIGLVIIAGTIIGLILEKSGAAYRMAEVVLRIVGPKRPQLAMSLIGYIVSIPVFCDSGFIILSSASQCYDCIYGSSFSNWLICDACISTTNSRAYCSSRKYWRS